MTRIHTLAVLALLFIIGVDGFAPFGFVGVPNSQHTHRVYSKVARGVGFIRRRGVGFVGLNGVLRDEEEENDKELQNILDSSEQASSGSTSGSTTIPTKVPSVGDPQTRQKVEYSIDSIMKELKAINQEGTRKYCILGTRHCSYLHQQIIELLSYALILSGNHVFTSGAGGTNAAAIRGGLRADEKMLTVVLPQSLKFQSSESQLLLSQVTNLITNPQNDDLTLDAASRLCNSELLSQTDQLICFAFHDSGTVIEASREAKVLDKVVTVLYLD